MPAGTQQTIEGMLCLLCTGFVDAENTSQYNNEVCSDCDELHEVYCPGCGDSAYNLDSLNRYTFNRVREANIPTMSFTSTNDTGETVCENCWHSCSECGTIYQYEDGAIDCCYQQDSNIHNYSYRPTPEFHEVREDGLVHSHFGPITGVLYMGIELEIAKMARCVDDFIDTTINDRFGNFAYFKEDGSIGDDGAELVTMPATLQAFERVFPFDALDNARKNGARSFHYQSCGFHVHVSRSAFSATHMWRFIKFQLNNPKLCQAVAQREESSYATWHYEENERTSLPDYVKGKRSNGRRYLAINFQNRATVELRYFKGNILRAAIMKNVEFVQSIYDYTKHMSFQQVVQGHLSDLKYMQWLSMQDAYPNLRFFIDNNCNQESE